MLETILRAKVNLSTSRASELMQIADGRKSLQDVRSATARRVRALRDPKTFFVSNEEEFPDIHAVPTLGPGNPNHLIDALAQSDASIRVAVTEALISGTRQSEFEAVINAVSDLYQRLSQAGR